MSPDFINGAFELGGAVMLWQNVRRLRQDKIVRGVDWRPTLLFTAWGVWNLFYYPHLDQWWSFAGGCAIVLANAAWLGLLFRYARANKGTVR